jgi:hypothetical protein
MSDPSRTCGCCGKPIEGIPSDMIYRRPVHFFMVPEAERALRVYHTDDVCVIDESTFLIRGVMRIRLTDRPGRWFVWGLWASVSRPSFERYLELYEVDADGEPPFQGLLAVSPPNYPDLLDAEVTVHLRGAKERPEFHPASFDHPLFREHRDGISSDRWHQIIAEIEEHHAKRRH